MNEPMGRWRSTGGATKAKLDLGLPRHLSAGTMARREVERCFSRRLADPLIGDIKLVVSELVTNAVEHGAGDIRLVVHAMADHVRVEVSDEGRGFIAPGHAPCERGLSVVDAVAERWGVSPGNTRVWCHLAVSTPAIARR
jgi:anti-sigma regulatory factor (Ser/Thr protein kinase)